MRSSTDVSSKAGYIDRLHYIAKPLLKNLARHLNRPQIEKPDLVTTHAAYWNLRKYAEGASSLSSRADLTDKTMKRIL